VGAITMGEENKQKLYKKATSKQSKKCNKKSCFVDGKNLNVLAAVTANVISDNFTNDELDILALFFTILGDSLATIAATNSMLCDNYENEPCYIEEIID
jgi:hypothetical protein